MNTTSTTAVISELSIHNTVGPVLEPSPSEGEGKTCNKLFALFEIKGVIDLTAIYYVLYEYIYVYYIVYYWVYKQMYSYIHNALRCIIHLYTHALLLVFMTFL